MRRKRALAGAQSTPVLPRPTLPPRPTSAVPKSSSKHCAQEPLRASSPGERALSVSFQVHSARPASARSNEQSARSRRASAATDTDSNEKDAEVDIVLAGWSPKKTPSNTNTQTVGLASLSQIRTKWASQSSLRSLGSTGSTAAKIASMSTAANNTAGSSARSSSPPASEPIQVQAYTLCKTDIDFVLGIKALCTVNEKLTAEKDLDKKSALEVIRADLISALNEKVDTFFGYENNKSAVWSPEHEAAFRASCSQHHVPTCIPSAMTIFLNSDQYRAANRSTKQAGHVADSDVESLPMAGVSSPMHTLQPMTLDRRSVHAILIRLAMSARALSAAPFTRVHTTQAQEFVADRILSFQQGLASKFCAARKEYLETYSDHQKHFMELRQTLFEERRTANQHRREALRQVKETRAFLIAKYGDEEGSTIDIQPVRVQFAFNSRLVARHPKTVTTRSSSSGPASSRPIVDGDRNRASIFRAISFATSYSQHVQQYGGGGVVRPSGATKAQHRAAGARVEAVCKGFAARGYAWALRFLMNSEIIEAAFRRASKESLSSSLGLHRTGLVIMLQLLGHAPQELVPGCLLKTGLVDSGILFQNIDIDGDGFLTCHEFERWFVAHLPRYFSVPDQLRVLSCARALRQQLIRTDAELFDKHSLNQRALMSPGFSKAAHRGCASVSRFTLMEREQALKDATRVEMQLIAIQKANAQVRGGTRPKKKAQPQQH